MWRQSGQQDLVSLLRCHAQITRSSAGNLCNEPQPRHQFASCLTLCLPILELASSSLVLVKDRQDSRRRRSDFWSSRWSRSRICERLFAASWLIAAAGISAPDAVMSDTGRYALDAQHWLRSVKAMRDIFFVIRHARYLSPASSLLLAHDLTFGSSYLPQ